MAFRTPRYLRNFICSGRDCHCFVCATWKSVTLLCYDCTVAAYLDMLVRVEQNGFSTSVYHKVDDFSFPVVLYTFPGRNAPIKMGSNVFSSHILRFARICSVKDDFVERAEKVFFPTC